MSSFIITPNIGGAVATAAESARARRDDLVKVSSRIAVVADRLDADDAIIVLRNLKEFSREVETQRAAAKAPVLDLGKKIDGLARELVGSVDAEVNRISRVIGAFEIEERRKADEARIAANNEAQRIAREAEAKEIAARRAAPTAEAADRAADAVVEKAQQQIVAVQQQAANAAAPKAANSQLREDICFEVTDIRALYAENPMLVTLEPNGSAIRAILRANPNMKIAGLRHWREAKLNVR